MKKIFVVLLSLFIVFPFLNVDAISCYSEVIDVKDTYNFSCSSVEGEEFRAVDNSNGEDLSKYFEFVKEEDGKLTVNIVDQNIKFSESKEIGSVKIGDGVGYAIVQIKNQAYVKPSTTTSSTTTTTKDVNVKTLVVTLDPNDGSEIQKKECSVTSNNTTCSITLPKIAKENFSGWGTAKTCKEGKEGTIRVDKDVTYYACYTTNENVNKETEEVMVLLKSLSLVDKDTNEVIDFGTFSIKKKEYEFKVLNSVSNIDVKAEAKEGIEITVTGNENLVVGENKIVIKLVNKDNKENEYILKVTKLNEGETINNVKFLKSLVVGGYNINFNKEQFVYNLTIPSKISKLAITAISENENDVVEIKNNENLVDGSTIIISINDGNGEPTIYSINIAKESNVNLFLIGGIVLVVLLIIILIILIIVKSNKKKGNKSNNNTPPMNPPSNNSNNGIEILNI